MSPKKPVPLTPAEWKVMRIAWHHERFAARDVYVEAGEQHGMSVSTVNTHLRRLPASSKSRTDQGSGPRRASRRTLPSRPPQRLTAAERGI